MKLSIALTTYNGARFLQEQLGSFLSQTRQPDEVVICDENSSDTTAQILDEFRRTAPFTVRVQINPERLGIIANFEKAIRLCTGDVIFLADQDDYWHSDKLARHEAVYAANPDVGLVFSDANVVDHQLRPLGMRMSQRLGITPERLAQLSGPDAFRLLIRRPFLLGCTISFRSRFRPMLDPFPNNQLHDNWIPFVLTTLTRFQGIAEPLIDYRSHDQQTVGVHTLRDDQPSPALPTRADEFRRQISLLETLDHQVSSFRDQVQIPDLARLIVGKRRFIERRMRIANRSLPIRLISILRDLVTGGYLLYAGYPKDAFLRDLKGN